MRLNRGLATTAALILWGACSVSSVHAASEREAIALNSGERDHVLAEMRTMLSSLQGVVAALADEDMAAVAIAARSSGMGMARSNPATLPAKLPPRFKQWGGSIHRGFDELAMAAEQGESSDMVLMRLGEQMQTCVSCHAAFRITAE